jgi:endoglucanase
LCLYGAQERDLWYLPEGQRETKPGCGVVIPASDCGAMYDRELFESLRTLSEENHIPWQIQVRVEAPSDARAFQRGGVAAAGLAVPVRNLHSPVELASLTDAQAMLDLCRSFLEQEGRK